MALTTNHLDETLTMSHAAPAPETVLSWLDKPGSIPDTRTLYPGAPSNDAAGQWSEDAFRANAAWQLALQSVLNSLGSRDMIKYAVKDEVRYALTQESSAIVAEGSPEARVWAALPADGSGAGLDVLRRTLPADTLKIGQGQAFRKKWIKKLPDGTFARAADSVEDTSRAELAEIARTGRAPGGDEKKAADLRKRKLLDVRKLVYFSVEKGPKFALKIEQLETEITTEMLQSGAWKTAKFKPYNFEAEGTVPTAGAFHPLLKVREEFRKIFFEMGFTEMPTNRFVESSFWCFDSLFVAQQHPARDVQDTFFVKGTSVVSLLASWSCLLHYHCRFDTAFHWLRVSDGADLKHRSTAVGTHS